MILNIFEKQLSVEKVILYGSRAKGSFKTYSDIDLTVFGNLDLFALQAIENELYELNLPYTFDVSQHQVIQNQDLLNHIARVGVEVFSRLSTKN